MHPGFRQDIQGLRALAVLLVVLDHARIGPFHGGFIGVDVFFVISGFLITGLLVSESERTGRVSLLGFYARRARRILPAATLVIMATVAASIYFLSAVEASGAIEDALWATFFAANFKFALDGTDYFQNDTPPSPLQHYWSLAVEEQFYVVWPLLVLLLCLFSAWRARRSVGARSTGPRVRDLGVSPLVVIIGVSFAFSVSYSTTDPVSAYFSPFTRAWELGIGALVACLSTRLILLRPAVQAAPLVGRSRGGRGGGARLRHHHGLPGLRRGAARRGHRRVAGRWPPAGRLGTAAAAGAAADAGGRRLVLLDLPVALAGADHRQPRRGGPPSAGSARSSSHSSSRCPRSPTTSWRTPSGARRSSGSAACAECCSIRRSWCSPSRCWPRPTTWSRVSSPAAGHRSPPPRSDRAPRDRPGVQPGPRRRAGPGLGQGRAERLRDPGRPQAVAPRPRHRHPRPGRVPVLRDQHRPPAVPAR